MVADRSRLPALTVVLVMVLTLLSPSGPLGSATAPASAASGTTSSRIEGGNRYATAAQVSRHAFPGGSPVVYLARGDVFADALAGGSLTDGPVLLVRPCSGVPSAVLAEVERLRPSRVIALGGPDAVCDEVLQTVAAGRPTSRLAGPTRYATAVQISRRAFPRGGVAEAYVARGDGDTETMSPDAVVGGVLTAGPVLTLPASGVPAVVRAELARLAPRRLVALGGTTAVSAAQLQEAAGGRPTHRLAGTTRYDTATAIARYHFPDRLAVVYLARGDVFADAVAGGALTDGPILLVDGKRCGSLSSAVHRYLAGAAPARVIALGGSTGLCQETLDAAVGAAGGLWVSTTSLPEAATQVPYTARVSPRGGAGSYGWSVPHPETLPPGLQAWTEGDQLVIGGVPLVAGRHEVQIHLWDRVGSARLRLPLTVVASPAGTGWRATDIATGPDGDSSCATTSGGKVVCWGMNLRGQLGSGSTGPWARETPVEVVGLPAPARDVAVGLAHACALLTDGSVRCWGANGSGQLGDGTTTDRLTPVRATGVPTTARELVAGRLSTCALTQDGQSWCWGLNVAGQLGDGSTQDRTTAVRTQITEAVARLTMGDTHTCAVTSTGRASCWGGNWSGQTGHGTQDPVVPLPREVTALGPVTSLATGAHHTCALGADGAVSCWGDDWRGQLGNGRRGHTMTTPTPLTLPERLTSLAGSGNHTCGLTGTGQAVCWGENGSGQAVPGAPEQAVPGVVAQAPAGLTTVSAGRTTTCALTAGGTPWCWGLGGQGQTGSGDLWDSSPQPVAGFLPP